MSGGTPTAPTDISGKAGIVLTTKGDVATFDTARTRLAIGSNDQILTADSTQAKGVKWATASGGGWEELANLQQSSASPTFSSGTFSLKKYLQIYAFIGVSGSDQIRLRMGNSSVSSANIYTYNISENGGASTITLDTKAKISKTATGSSMFFTINMHNNDNDLNHFVTNSMSSSNWQSGGGYWNSTAQVNIIEFGSLAGSVNIATSSFMLVLGRD